MVRGAIAYEGQYRLLCVRVTLTSARYIAEVLQPMMVPLIRRLTGTPFQQKNVRSHASATVRAFLWSIFQFFRGLIHCLFRRVTAVLETAGGCSQY